MEKSIIVKQVNTLFCVFLVVQRPTAVTLLTIQHRQSNNDLNFFSIITIIANNNNYYLLCAKLYLLEPNSL